MFRLEEHLPVSLFRVTLFIGKSAVFLFPWLIILFSAANGSVYSDDNLYDPYNIWNTFSGAFLRIPFLDNVITDTHFHARERMGRMLTFLARITKGDAIENQSTFDAKSYRAVALDEVTALLLNVETGHAQAVGENYAYICQPSRVPEICESDIPLTFKGNAFFLLGNLF